MKGKLQKIQYAIFVRKLLKAFNHVNRTEDLDAKKVKVNSYPDTKAPVPRRKIKASEAPNISKTLSGLIEKGLGFGGLKLGGGVIEGPEGSSFVLSEVEAIGVSED